MNLFHLCYTLFIYNLYGVESIDGRSNSPSTSEYVIDSRFASQFGTRVLRAPRRPNEIATIDRCLAAVSARQQSRLTSGTDLLSALPTDRLCLRAGTLSSGHNGPLRDAFAAATCGATHPRRRLLLSQKSAAQTQSLFVSDNNGGDCIARRGERRCCLAAIAMATICHEDGGL